MPRIGQSCMVSVWYRNGSFGSDSLGKSRIGWEVKGSIGKDRQGKARSVNEGSGTAALERTGTVRIVELCRCMVLSGTFRQSWNGLFRCVTELSVTARFGSLGMDRRVEQRPGEDGLGTAVTDSIGSSWLGLLRKVLLRQSRQVTSSSDVERW